MAQAKTTPARANTSAKPARKKPLTARVLRGLGLIRPLVAVNIQNGEGGDFQHLKEVEIEDVEAALAWIDDRPEPPPYARMSGDDPNKVQPIDPSVVRDVEHRFDVDDRFVKEVEQVASRAARNCRSKYNGCTCIGCTLARMIETRSQLLAKGAR